MYWPRPKRNNYLRTITVLGNILDGPRRPLVGGKRSCINPSCARVSLLGMTSASVVCPDMAGHCSPWNITWASLEWHWLRWTAMQGLEWPDIIPNANRFEKRLLAWSALGEGWDGSRWHRTRVTLQRHLPRLLDFVGEGGATPDRTSSRSHWNSACFAEPPWQVCHGPRWESTWLRLE